MAARRMGATPRSGDGVALRRAPCVRKISKGTIADFDRAPDSVGKKKTQEIPGCMGRQRRLWARRRAPVAEVVFCDLVRLRLGLKCTTPSAPSGEARRVFGVGDGARFFAREARERRRRVGPARGAVPLRGATPGWARGRALWRSKTRRNFPRSPQGRRARHGATGRGRELAWLEPGRGG
jgi:hypothetical protein